MKKALVSLTVFWMAALAGWGSQGVPAQEEKMNPVSPDFLFNNVVIKMKGEKIISGLLVSMDSSALFIRSGGRDEAVRLESLDRVSIAREPKTGPATACGSVAGVYVGNLLFSSAKNQPTSYLTRQYGWGWLFQLGFLSVGGLLGHIAGIAFEKDFIEVDFPDSEAGRLAAWKKLKRVLSGTQFFMQKKFHLTVIGGQVFFNVVNRYKDAFEASGMVTEDYSYYSVWGSGEEYSSPASAFNLIRRLQLTFSLTPRLETGVAVLFLGEPSVSGRNYRGGRQTWAGVKLDSMALYAVANYQPLRGILPDRAKWNIGLGVGAAKVDFRLKTHCIEYFPTSPYSRVQETEYSVSDWHLSGFAFTEIQGALSSNVSLGLAGDIAWVPAQKVPGCADVGIPDQKIKLGNASLGAIFALHF